MTSLTTSRTPGVASISRAMRVIEAFADRPQGVALTRLSTELGYGKATLSKVLATMERGLSFVKTASDALGDEFRACDRPTGQETARREVRGRGSASSSQRARHGSCSRC